MSSNFGIPVAAIADLTGKPEDKINGRMTAALTIYSATFMRYAWSSYLYKDIAHDKWLLLEIISFSSAMLSMRLRSSANYIDT